MKQIRAGIIGAAGYTGGEMLRLLIQHPGVRLQFAHSRSQAGAFVYQVHTDLLGDTEMRFTDQLAEADVWFLCLGHGESRVFLAQNPPPPGTRIIDLSQDFRLDPDGGERQFVYGLPEWQREALRAATNIANPGCFATAIQLGLLPLAKAGLLGEVHTTGITGSTGAGQKKTDTTHHSWRNNNVNGYKTLNHQHTREIDKVLNTGARLHFVPWRGDFTRGIYITSYLDCPLEEAEAVQLYKDYYEAHPFTHVSDRMIDLKQVVNTNKALLFLEKQAGKLIIHSALDNLLKGASGQAVQNMNLMFGLEETQGLKLKSTAF